MSAPLNDSAKATRQNQGFDRQPEAKKLPDNLIGLDIKLRCAQHLATVHAAGYDVYAPRDYEEIPGLVERTGRQKQSPMLSISRNDFAHGDAFWLFLMRDGEAVGGCAAKFSDLRDEPFDAYLRRTSKAQYGRKSDPIATVAGPIVEDLRGRLIYVGELELHPEHRGKVNLLFAFMRLLHGLAADMWSEFDWIYAFVPKEHVKLCDGYGFSWKLPRAITWVEPVPAGRLNSHWLVATKRSHFKHMWAT